MPVGSFPMAHSHFWVSLLCGVVCCLQVVGREDWGTSVTFQQVFLSRCQPSIFIEKCFLLVILHKVVTANPCWLIDSWSSQWQFIEITIVSLSLFHKKFWTSGTIAKHTCMFLFLFNLIFPDIFLLISRYFNMRSPDWQVQPPIPWRLFRWHNSNGAAHWFKSLT